MANSDHSAPRILVLATKQLHPVDDGKKAVLKGIMSYFLSRTRASHICYAVIGPVPEKPGVSYPWQHVAIPRPSRLVQIWLLVFEAMIRRRRSFQEAIFYSSRTRARIHRLVDDWKPDLIFIDTLRLGQFLEDTRYLGVQRFLYMDDLFYLRFEAMLGSTSEHPDSYLDPSGTFASNLPRFARALLRLDPVKKALLGFEKRAIERRELGSPSNFEKCLLINPQEAQILKVRTGAANVDSLRPVLYDSSFPGRRRFNGDPLFLMLGTLRNPAHRFAVCYFLEHCMSRVLDLIPDVRIKIVGAGADTHLLQLANRYPETVEVCGFVEQLDDLMCSACALLVPLHFGGGLKLKTLTALHYGLPVIATSHGVAGLDIEPNNGILIDDEVSNFPQHMIQLLDKVFNQAMSGKAKRNFDEVYSKDAVFQEYDRLFGIQE